MAQVNQDMHKHPYIEHPADLLKFISWNKLVNSYEEAVAKIVAKKPILGEPIVVPFKFWKGDVHEDSVYDASTNQNGYTEELVFGIGSTDPDHPYIHCSISHDVLNNAVVVDSTGKQLPLGELLNNYITRDDANAIIDARIKTTLSDNSVINEIANKVAVVNEQVINDTIDERLRWKPLSDLLK
jgi:hypothetical protein